MDLNNPVIQLCIEGTRAEYAGKPEDAAALYWRAWQTAQDDYEACIAAHYVARFQKTPEEVLRWNQVALKHAGAVGDDRVHEFYPSLYVSLGGAYEALGDEEAARRFFDLAAGLGFSRE